MAKKRVAQKPPKAENTCMHDERVIYARGLCLQCYFALQRDMRSSGRTDQDYVDAGLMKPSQRSGSTRMQEMIGERLGKAKPSRARKGAAK